MLSEGDFAPGQTDGENAFDGLSTEDVSSDDSSISFLSDQASAVEVSDDLNNQLTPPQSAEAQRQFYAEFCESCYGVNGLGGALFESTITSETCTKVNCADIPALYNYVVTTMPPLNPDSCVDACAMGVAQLIASDFMSTRAQEGVPVGPFGAALESATKIEVYVHDTGEVIKVPANHL